MKYLRTFEEKTLPVSKAEIDQYDGRLRDVLSNIKQNIPVKWYGDTKEYPTEFILKDATHRVKNNSIYSSPKTSDYDLLPGAARPFVDHTYGGVCIRLSFTDKIEFVLIDGGKSLDIYKPNGCVLDENAISRITTMFKRGAEYIGIDSSTDVHKIERVLNREVKNKDEHINKTVRI